MRTLRTYKMYIIPGVCAYIYIQVHGMATHTDNGEQLKIPQVQTIYANPDMASPLPDTYGSYITSGIYI